MQDEQLGLEGSYGSARQLQPLGAVVGALAKLGLGATGDELDKGAHGLVLDISELSDRHGGQAVT